jgi:hypothetical protein
LSAIEDRRVVPIVGPRLFHNLVAERLAAELRISVDHLVPGFDVNDVVYVYEDFQSDPTPINNRIRRIVGGLAVPIPEPLRLLAEIPDFQQRNSVLRPGTCQLMDYVDNRGGHGSSGAWEIAKAKGRLQRAFPGGSHSATMKAHL